VAGLQPPGVDWIKLNTNENPYPPSHKVVDALKNIDFAGLRLYPDSESRGLREAIAEKFGVRMENVFVGNGSDEVLALAFQAFLCDKKNVLMPDISYAFYQVWSAMFSVGVNTVPISDGFNIDADDYKNGAGVVIANPNAPTGIALPLAEVEKIARNNPDGVVIIDEAYIDFARVESAAALIDKYDNLLVVRTFSKSYSLAGLRVGFAIGGQYLIDGLNRVKNSFNSYPLDTPAQIGAKAAVCDVDYWNETIKRIVETRDRTAMKLRGLGYNVLDSQANFLFMEAGNAKELYESLYAEKILVRYWNQPKISGFLRVSIGSDAEMEAFIKCIERQTKQR
jgi:histidinol-phosphate aminotransferase